MDVLVGRKNTGKIENYHNEQFLKNDDVFNCLRLRRAGRYSLSNFNCTRGSELSAKLRLPSNVSPERRDRFVRNWLRKLDLTQFNIEESVLLMYVVFERTCRSMA